MSQKLARLLSIVAITTGLVFTTINCGNTAPSSTNTASTTGGSSNLIPVTIGYSQLRISLPVFVAMERGIFRKNGLDVQLKSFDTAQPMMQGLVEGKLNMAGYTAIPITVNAMNRANVKLYFLTTMVEDSGHRISYLLRRKGDAGRPKSIADLRGKRIGILPTNAYKAWIGQILKGSNIAPEAVAITQVAPQQEVASLKTGGVDVLFTGDPMATAALRSGVAELMDDSPSCPKYILNPFPFGSFNIRQDWADAHPKEVAAVKASLNEAVDFINQHEKESKAYMKPYLPAAFQGDVELYPDALYWTTSETKDESYSKIMASYASSGIIKDPYPLSALIMH